MNESIYLNSLFVEKNEVELEKHGFQNIRLGCCKHRRSDVERDRRTRLCIVIINSLEHLTEHADGHTSKMKVVEGNEYFSRNQAALKFSA